MSMGRLFSNLFNPGNPTKNWGRPSPIFNPFTGEYETDGYVWRGQDPATLDDVKALEDKYGAGVKVDMLSVCGRKDPKWSTYARANRAAFKTRIKL